jgi:branched-chain amino acid aminotransferase
MALSDCRFVWKNGTIVPWAEATVHVSCHGLHYGTGVFEGIRCYETRTGPAVFRLGAHLDRWLASARVYGMLWPYALQDLERAVVQVIEANRFLNCYVRPIAFYGSQTLSVHPRGCPVEVMILAWPWDSYLGNGAQERGIDVGTSPWRKLSSLAIPTAANACGQYLNSVLALQDALLRGFREALLLDDQEMVTEGSRENLFLVKDGRLVTNDERSSILIGVTRDTVLHLAADTGLPVDIKRISLDDLMTADEAFFTGTTAEITPIATVDMQPIGDGSLGPVTANLQRAFRKVTKGSNQKYANWLTYVPRSMTPGPPARGRPDAGPPRKEKT